MSRAKAPLTPAGGLLMVRRVEAGTPQADVARQMSLSGGAVAKRWSRWCEEHGEAGRWWIAARGRTVRRARP